MTMLAILCIPLVIVPRSAGTLPTNRILFVLFLLGVIVVVGGLTFLPAFSLARLPSNWRCSPAISTDRCADPPGAVTASFGPIRFVWILYADVSDIHGHRA